MTQYFYDPANDREVSDAQLRRENPNTPLRIPLSAGAIALLGVEPILESPRPSCNQLLEGVRKNRTTVDANGNRVWAWEIYQKYETQEEIDAAILRAEAATTATLKAECEIAIAEHIQAQVDAYNEAKGLTLTDVKSCALYAMVDGYTHQAFCQAVWSWNVLVWETARQKLSQALAGEITITSPEDALALLPGFSFES